MHPLKFSCNGKSLTYREWSKELGISEIALRKRIQSGWSVEKAFSAPLDKSKSKKESEMRRFTCRGLSMTLGQWAKHTGIPYYVLSYRVNNLDKWTLEQALTAPNHALRFPQHLSYNGESLTINEWSRKIGVPVNAIYARMRRSDDLSKILNPNLAKRWGGVVHEVWYKGRKMSLYGWSKVTGISRQVLANRYNAGIHPPELFAKPKPRVKMQFTMGGKTRSVGEWARERGLLPRTVRARLKRGMTIEQALSPKDGRGRPRKF